MLYSASIISLTSLNGFSVYDVFTVNSEKEMAKIAIKEERVDLLLGFTGIDYYGELLLLYEIGDIARFSNPKKLVSRVDLAPSLYQSGNISRMCRITKQGNSRIRLYLVESSKMAARYDPKIKTFYERIL
jgi:transposase